jgi:hypothetical protein
MPSPPLGETILEVLAVVLVAALLSVILTVAVIVIDGWLRNRDR